MHALKGNSSTMIIQLENQQIKIIRSFYLQNIETLTEPTVQKIRQKRNLLLK